MLRFAQLALTGGVLIAMMLLIDSRGYERGKDDATMAYSAQVNKARDRVDDLRDRLQVTQASLDQALHFKESYVKTTSDKLMVTIEKEIANAPQLAGNPDCSLTLGVRDALNSTRRLSSNPTLVSTAAQ